MASEKSQPQAEAAKTEPEDARTGDEPCWKKKAAADAGFLENMKDHVKEFMSTSMDQHRICLKKTIRGVGDKFKMTGSIFGSANAENDGGVEGAEHSKEVQTTTAQ